MITPAQIVASALERRTPLLRSKHDNTYRLLHGAGEGCPGLVVERFADVLIAQLHEGEQRVSAATALEIGRGFADAVAATAIYRKTFPKDRNAETARRLEAAHADATPWWGAPAAEEFDVREGGLTFRIRPYDGFSVGLFCEQRLNRRRVRELAGGRRVLNLCAYTCGFSVAAAAGGAPETTSVDVSPKFLEWGRRNFAANGIDCGEVHRFIASDVQEYFRRAERQGRTFDFVLLDPPTFGRARRGGGVLSLPEAWPRLIGGCMSLLSPGGVLFVATNHRPTTVRDLEQRISRAARDAGRAVSVIARPKLPVDFPNDAAYGAAIFVEVR